MKQMYKNTEYHRKLNYYYLGGAFMMVLVYSSLLFFKYRTSVYINTIDYFGGVMLVIFLFLLFINAITYKNKSEEIHNLYLEMVLNNGVENEKEKTK